MKIEETIRGIFEESKKRFDIEAELDLNFIERRPIVGENVYGEAFPSEDKIWLEVFPYDVTEKETLKNVCHELTHIKHPQLDHNSEKFDEIVRRHIEKIGR